MYLLSLSKYIKIRFVRPQPCKVIAEVKIDAKYPKIIVTFCASLLKRNNIWHIFFCFDCLLERGLAEKQANLSDVCSSWKLYVQMLYRGITKMNSLKLSILLEIFLLCFRKATFIYNTWWPHEYGISMVQQKCNSTIFQAKIYFLMFPQIFSIILIGDFTN